MNRLFQFLCLVSFLFGSLAFAQIDQPKRSQGLRVNPGQGTHTLIQLQGPGKFVSAHISKQGGSSDLTFISLDIDGQNVASLSLAAARNWGLTEPNPYGIQLLSGNNLIKNLAIGFGQVLHFESELLLRVTVREAGVQQILANVVHGK